MEGGAKRILRTNPAAATVCSRSTRARSKFGRGERGAFTSP